MVSNTPSLVLLSNLPNYQELFDKENHQLLSTFKILTIKDLFNHANLTKYYKECPCDYLLPADLTRKEADNLIKHLKDRTLETSTLDQDLIDRYRQNIWDKIGFMFTALDLYQTTLDNRQLQILESEAHKIAGSAASYGFKILGDLARQMDVYFHEKHGPEDNIRYCAHQLRKMLFAFQKIET